MSSNPITIRNLGPEDAHVLDRVRPGTFEGDLDPAKAWAVLATRVNEMVVAMDRGEVIGFVLGTTMMRPDKPNEFFVNEIGVHEDYRRQGVGRRLMERITELAMDRGCFGLWVLSKSDNKDAQAFYQALDGKKSTGEVMFDWPF
ncbi:GNAT family N-acetyltransferase [bacterium]|nr:GNAT family N-acetyltransferase [bacterium]